MIRNKAVTGLVSLLGVFNLFRSLPPSEAELVEGLQNRKPIALPVQRHLTELKPQDAWHSWDPAPWEHPWLTKENLEASSIFGKQMLSGFEAEYSEKEAKSLRYGFVGNIANNMTMRALSLRRQGYDIDIILHPQDEYIMAQPGWELSNAVIEDGETNIARLEKRGFELPDVKGVIKTSTSADWPKLRDEANSTDPAQWNRSRQFLRQLDVLISPAYMSYLPTLQALQTYDANFAAQAPYLAYLANKPYLAAQTGGDLWFEAARNDVFGRLQRKSYAEAAAILATNPWAFAHARRYGFRNVIYVPLLVDTENYSPGSSPVRKDWQAEVGGDFFVLATARVDTMWKGSGIGIEGYIRFAANHPGARLALIGWGNNKQEALDILDKHGLAERTLLLPISGKIKLVEYLRAADCLLDQFKIGYYGATVLEAMACGLPVVMRLITEQYDALCPTGAPPVLNAATPDEVADRLNRLAISGDERVERSKKSRRWIEENHSVAVWGRHYGALLCATARGDTFDFRPSPLGARLSASEKEYHADSLSSAPPFPQYII